MTLSPPTDPADAVFSDEARATRAARRLRTLEELAEIGMEIARVLRRRVMDEAVQAADDRQPADTALGLAFARVSRAVRQTLALEDKLDRPPQPPVLSPEAERTAWLADLKASPEIAALRVAIRKHEVRAKVEQTIASEADGTDAERLLVDLEERLDDAEAGEDFFDRPIGEMVAQICRDLGVTPDWSLWEDEDWAIDEAERQPPDSPYAERKREIRGHDTYFPPSLGANSDKEIGIMSPYFSFDIPLPTVVPCPRGYRGLPEGGER